MDSEDICLSVFLCICVGEGMGDKIKPSIPAGLRERGYRRQNQAEYTHWPSRARVWETKPSRLYPLAFASEGMGDKIKSIYPLVFAGEGIGDKIKPIIPFGLRGRGYGRQKQVDYTHWLSRARVWETKPGRLYPLAFVPVGRSKRFCQDKPQRYRKSGAQQEILSG